MAGVIFDGKTVAPAILVEKEIVKTKFGLSVDTWIGNVSEDGGLNQPKWTGVLNFEGVTILGTAALYAKFYANNGVTGVVFDSLKKIYTGGLNLAFAFCDKLVSADLGALETVEMNGMYQTFNSCDGLIDVDLSSLTSITSSSGMYEAFKNCTSLPSINLSSLQTVSGSGLSHTFDGCTALKTAYLGSLTTATASNCMSYIFNGCKELIEVDFSSLQSIGSSCFSSAFYNCSKLPKISFPALTSVQSNSFGTSTSSSAFRYCTALTEIHFRADMQATIEALSQYANKWGATNATIYFDL